MNDAPRPTRRSYLKLVGGAAGIPLVSRSASGHKTDYDEVVDIVAAGADDTGEAPIDEVVTENAHNDTLLEFPVGRYLVDDLTLTGLSNFGIRAAGNATLVPGDNCDDWITIARVSDFLFDGFTLDHTSLDCAPTVNIIAKDGLQVRDIVKQGYHDGTNTAFGFAITQPQGTGIVERLRLSGGSIPVHPVGVYVQGRGTITFRDCQIEGFGNNGLYASLARGPVKVEGGYFRNNDRSSIRLGSPDSYVSGAHIVVDDGHLTNQNLRGIRFSDGPGPVRVEDCKIELLDGIGMGGIVNAYNGGSLEVHNTHIKVGSDYHDPWRSSAGYGILLDETNGTAVGHRTLENVTITGSGERGAAIRVRRGTTTITDCCLHQTGGRDGIRFEKSPQSVVVAGTTVNVAGQAMVGDAGVETRAITYSGDCVPTDRTTDEETETDTPESPFVRYPPNPIVGFRA